MLRMLSLGRLSRPQVPGPGGEEDGRAVDRLHLWHRAAGLPAPAGPGVWWDRDVVWGVWWDQEVAWRA